MQLLNNNNITDHSSEYDMQVDIDAFLRKQKYSKLADRYHKVNIPHIVLREFRIPEIGRISDHVMIIGRSRAVNIECKLFDIVSAIQQAKDHLRWCDYSIIVMPPDGDYIANKYKTEIIDNGIGLFYWFKGVGVFEFIYPKFNRNKDKLLKKVIVNRIKNRHTNAEELIQSIMEDTFHICDDSQRKEIVNTYIKKYSVLLQRYSKEFLYKI